MDEPVSRKSILDEYVDVLMRRWKAEQNGRSAAARVARRERRAAEAEAARTAENLAQQTRMF